MTQIVVSKYSAKLCMFKNGKSFLTVNFVETTITIIIFAMV